MKIIHKKLLLTCSIALLVIGIIGAITLNGPSQRMADIKSKSGTDFGDLLDVSYSTGSPIVIKDYTGFRVGFNTQNHTPAWVSWELLGSETDGAESRRQNFWQDLEIDGCPTTKDYSNSGYDRGHLCPAADQKWDSQAMTDCFSLANIAPQDHKLNTGAWKTLESKERLWAQRDSSIVIVAGPIYSDNDTQRIGNAGVRVPSAFFKVMIAPWLKEPRGIGFIYPNMISPGNMMNYSMTIREVEQATGLDFFHTLPDALEEEIETKSSFKEWNYARR
ncbi:MAG: DNA/RNA non-specific endonuclease [Muribaculaceae bacterium]|nr:DNA/RNA non-specific endonuclease [Muribaculaceae bacterium]